MLHTETIAPTTLELLKKIMRDENLPSFLLVDGTSLALQIGHRISADLDLFTNSPFDETAVNDHFWQHYGLITDFMAKKTMKGEIDGVQIDCIAHEYPWIRPFVEENGVRLASMEDICAMKLNAIAGNGTRIKDFVDVAYLSTRFSLNQMLDFYEEKYHSNPLAPMKAITFFNDVNQLEPVRMVGGKKLKWKAIEKRLVEMEKKSGVTFITPPM